MPLTSSKIHHWFCNHQRSVQASSTQNKVGGKLASVGETSLHGAKSTALNKYQIIPNDVKIYVAVCFFYAMNHSIRKAEH